MKKGIERLKGYTLGLITPSSPLSSKSLSASVAFFESIGCKVKVGSNNTKSNRFLAGTDEQRAADIMKFYQDSEVDVLLATNGGAGSIRTLNLLDYKIIKNNPKPIVGFSDTTSLQLGIYSQTNLKSMTGFTCRDIEESDELDSLLEDSFVNCLLNNNYDVIGGEKVNSGVVTAQLLGGNLQCICTLIGTKFQPSFRDKILFFEEVGAEPYVLDGMFSQLYLSGIFDEVAGVIIGQMKNCNANYFPERDGTSDDVINDWCKKIKVPCIKSFPYGHFDTRCVLPIGQMATLDASNCKLSINNK